MRVRIAGAIGALSAIAVGELISGLVTSIGSPLEAVGNWVIDNVPPAIKDWAIDLLGTADKPALLIGIAATTGLLGALVAGPLAKRSQLGAGILFAGFGLFGFWALVRDPLLDPPIPLLTATLMAVIGWWVTKFLVGLTESPVNESATATDYENPKLATNTDPESDIVPSSPPSTDEVWSPSAKMGRRRFLLASSALVVLGAGSVALGRNLVARTKRILAGRDDVLLPAVSDPLPAVASGSSFPLPGITPIITPNEDFYLIDTALSVPQVDISTWTLKITGLVEREIELTLDDLLDMPMVERRVTLSCVSNQVGGDLIGTATWTGVPLPDLIRRADPAASAGQLVGRSVDDFTAGFPVENVFDGREVLVAIGMNGEPLPFSHGFPARLVVEGLYGYVSATKWLSQIELRTWDGFDGYWIPRGWAKVAPIKTQSRIDLPRHRQKIPAETATIAGVAWSSMGGIGRVEVQVDDQRWVEATLSDPLAETTWRQWMVPWENPSPGSHQLRVRATNGDGVTQDVQVRPPRPDGATGWHTVSVEVEET